MLNRRLAVLPVALLSFLLPASAVAQTAELSFSQAGPAVIAPGGRLDLKIKVTNTGGNVWSPVYPGSACHTLVDIDTFLACIAADGHYQGQYYVMLTAFDMDAPNPFVTLPWNALIGLPGPLNPGETVELATSIQGPTVPSHYSLSAIAGQGYYNFSWRIGHTPLDGYNITPHFDFVVASDITPPALTYHGAIAGACNLWPPNNKMVGVGTVSASDAQSTITRFDVLVSSTDPTASPADWTVSGSGTGPRSIALRATRPGNGSGRTYQIDITAVDSVGNTASSRVSCVVPHDQGK